MRTIRPHIENQISSKLNQIINGEIDPWEFAGNEYKKIMRSIATSLAPGNIIEDVLRRSLISTSTPQKPEIKENKR